MAMGLLTKKAIEGKVEHLYQHDAESFIWVLTWVCLRYEDGELLHKGRLLDEWLRVDAIGCHEKKSSFLSKLSDEDLRPSGSHGENWEVAQKCLAVIYSHYGPIKSRKMTDGEVFRSWLQDQVPVHLQAGYLLSGE